MIDSVLVSVEDSVYFRYLINDEIRSLNKLFQNDSTLSISIDFEGYNYVVVGGRAYYVLNPYLGHSISYREERSEADGVIDVVVGYSKIFEFNKKGELIFFLTPQDSLPDVARLICQAM